MASITATTMKRWFSANETMRSIMGGLGSALLADAVGELQEQAALADHALVRLQAGDHLRIRSLLRPDREDALREASLACVDVDEREVLLVIQHRGRRHHEHVATSRFRHRDVDEEVLLEQAAGIRRDDAHERRAGRRVDEVT